MRLTVCVISPISPARRSSSAMISTVAACRCALRSMARAEAVIRSRRVAEHHLHGLGAPAQGVCFAARRAKAVEYPLDRRELLLGRAGGLLGARGDLLHRFAQLLGRRRGFRQSARKFLGRRRHSLEEAAVVEASFFSFGGEGFVRGVDFDAVRTKGGSTDRVAIFELLTSAMWYPSLNTHETRNGDQLSDDEQFLELAP